MFSLLNEALDSDKNQLFLLKYLQRPEYKVFWEA
jgi:hypothetical protein